MHDPESPETESNDPDGADAAREPASDARPREIGGRESGLDPTRYGDWERNGRCIDF